MVRDLVRGEGCRAEWKQAIGKRKQLMWSMLRSTWAYRYFIVSSIKTEFMSRFIRSRIGGVWMIVNPLVQVCIYALIRFLHEWFDRKRFMAIWLISNYAVATIRR